MRRRIKRLEEITDIVDISDEGYSVIPHRKASREVSLILPDNPDHPFGRSGTVIIVYNEPKASAVVNWWLVAECLMLAAYAIMASIWIIFFTTP